MYMYNRLSIWVFSQTPTNLKICRNLVMYNGLFLSSAIFKGKKAIAWKYGFKRTQSYSSKKSFLKNSIIEWTFAIARNVTKKFHVVGNCACPFIGIVSIWVVEICFVFVYISMFLINKRKYKKALKLCSRFSNDIFIYVPNNKRTNKPKLDSCCQGASL